MDKSRDSLNLSVTQLRQLLETHDLRSRDLFFLKGATVLDDSFRLLYNEELNKETYPKLVFERDGEWKQTTTPLGVLFAGENYGLLTLEGNDGKALLIGFQKDAHFPNKAWQQFRKCNPSAPNLKGNLVFMRWQRPLNWSGSRCLACVRDFYRSLRDKKHYVFPFDE